MRIYHLVNVFLQESGAIFGFHNHAVWGGNPYRYADFTSNHSTFASLLLPVLARLDARGTKGVGLALQKALSFQIGSRQQNGDFDHVGFQEKTKKIFFQSEF